MAVGDLTPDQADYIARVAQGTGLDPTVVTAWLGAESHWGVTKPDHNYLNIGPGHTYASSDQAAAAAVGLINTSNNYSGIRAATKIGPLAQISAIKTSPWDQAHYSNGSLDAIYGQLSGGKVSSRTIPDPMSPAAGPSITQALSPSDVNNAIGGAIGGLAGSLFKGVFGSGIGQTILNAGLSIVFVAAGLGLIAMGLDRLANKSIREHFQNLTEILGPAKQAAEMAAIA